MLLPVGGDEELGRVEEVLPDDVCRGAEGCEGIEEGLRHPDTQGGVLLTEGLSGCDGRDARHRFRCRSGVDEDILVITAFTGRGEIVTNELAETKLEEAGEEGGY